ncbi:SAV_6107 family HEPN domain-containing protein [Corynebacterium sp. BF-R-2]|uniref:SAV_6107 family HEPN domain-containing protein n=1 Tax=Corynebacterium sp. BF-R-2 TaxID=2943494 RepID=UPI00211E97EF|nr:SAV_6107 family HEPN domain-containing protein [Corynebacterium sp. BF-R-2]MCQ9675655.1 SAV_6107 family HEPN domain-containing protein [Corynebacterium sp. BF-R-2]
MAQVISATAAARSRNREALQSVRRDRFVGQALDLLADARKSAARGRLEDALEMAYRASLRAAGARVAASTVARRRRLPSSAWEQVALIGPADAQWAAEFKDYSRVRSRVASGLDPVPGEDAVYEYLALAARYVDVTESELGFGGLAA